MNRRGLVAGLMLLAAWNAIAIGETLEEVEKALAEKMAAHKTLKFKQKTTSDMKTPEMQMKMEAESVITHARKPDNGWASRVESKTRTVHAMKDQPEQKQDAKMLTIADGKHMYILTETNEVTSAMRQKLDGPTAMNPFDVKALFAIQHREFDLKLLADEKIEGVACYAIETTPKKGENAEQMAAVFARSVSYYDKKTGLSIKGLVYDKDGKVTTTTTTTDVKINESVADDQFVFKAPPGVEVVDMSEMQQGSEQTAQNGKTESSESKTKSSEPAKAEPAGKEPAKTTQAKKPEEEKKKDPAGKAVKGLLKGLGK